MDEKPFEVGRGTVMIGGTMLIVVHEFRKAAGMSAPELMRVVIPDVKFAAAPYDVT